MWLDHVMSVGEPDPSPFPTSPWAIVGYLVTVAVAIAWTLLTRPRRRADESPPDPPPQLTNAATQQVADSAFTQIQQVMQAHIDAQASQIRRLESSVSRLEQERALRDDEDERKDQLIARLQVKVATLEAEARSE